MIGPAVPGSQGGRDASSRPVPSFPEGFRAFDEVQIQVSEEPAGPVRITRDDCRAHLLSGMEAQARRDALSRTDGHWPFLPVVKSPMRCQDLATVSPLRRIDWLAAVVSRAPMVLVSFLCIAFIAQ